MKQGKDAGGEAALCNGAGDGSGSEFAGPGMCGMRFNNHGASGSQSAGGVASGHGKCEWEIAGSEDCDGTDGGQNAAQIGAGNRLAIRQCGVDAGIAPGPFAEQVRKHAELSNGAAAFTGEAVFWETCFLVSAGDQCVVEREEFVCDFL